MRIAVSGSHGTGKTTLVHALVRALPTYEWLEEPYQSMIEEGHLFDAVPSFSDFEELLERSLTELADPLPHDMLFDRCPLDYLAYLANIAEPKDRRLEQWMPEVTEAVSRLDLVVYVPIEQPDRVHMHKDEGTSLRRRVDKTIREMLVEDGWAFGASVIEVAGSPEDRVCQVLTRIGGGR